MPSPTAGAGGPICGNGFLEPGENFDDPVVGLVGDLDGVECPADAVVADCSIQGTTQAFELLFDAPLGTLPTSVTLLVGYRSELATLPGGREIRNRVVAEGATQFFTFNDLEYAIRIVLVRTMPLEDGRQLTVEFDDCTPLGPTAADMACFVEGCSGAGGPIQGCTCSMAGPITL